jgi:hypothetical protein
VKSVKKKWKYLRDYFQRECKRNPKLKSGAGVEDMPKESLWHYFNMMLFVKDVLHTEKVESGLQQMWESVAAQEDFNDGEETEALFVNTFETLSPLPSPEQSV